MPPRPKRNYFWDRRYTYIYTGTHKPPWGSRGLIFAFRPCVYYRALPHTIQPVYVAQSLHIRRTKVWASSSSSNEYIPCTTWPTYKIYHIYIIMSRWWYKQAYIHIYYIYVPVIHVLLHSSVSNLCLSLCITTLCWMDLPSVCVYVAWLRGLRVCWVRLISVCLRLLFL